MNLRNLDIPHSSRRSSVTQSALVGYGGKQVLGRVVLAGGSLVVSGSQYLSSSTEHTLLSKPQSKPASQYCLVIEQFL
jgi:hypothetical protein